MRTKVSVLFSACALVAALPVSPAIATTITVTTDLGAAANSAAELFVDGFELGHTLRWSAEAP